MTKPTIYHNPRCSKSRTTLKLLEEAGHEPAVVEYLKAPLDAEQLERVFAALGKPPQEVMRFNEQIAKDLGLKAKDDRSREEWIRLIANNPILLERPIVVVGNEARVGRPPEQVLELF